MIIWAVKGFISLCEETHMSLKVNEWQSLNPQHEPLPAHTSTQIALIRRDSICCVQKSRTPETDFKGAKFLMDFLASPRASCKENISGREWTSQQKQLADLLIIYGCWKMWPKQNVGSFALKYQEEYFCEPFLAQKKKRKT